MKRNHSIKYFYQGILLLILLCSANIAGSQESDFKGYIVGPGDILNIQVWDHDDLNRAVEVSQDGTFSFPFIGQINASNRSVYEIEHLLTQRLSEGYLVAPQIAVNIQQYNNKKVFLFGEVEKPGSYPWRRDVSLLEIISDAGGFTDSYGTDCKIVRTRKEHRQNTPVSIAEAEPHEIITIDLLSLTSGHSQENIPIQPGDSIYINSADHLFVTGEVRNPGEIKWTNGLTVRQAISFAGGGTASAAINRTKILRLEEGKEVEIRPDLSDLVFPNDIIKVPQSYF